MFWGWSPRKQTCYFWLSALLAACSLMFVCWVWVTTDQLAVKVVHQAAQTADGLRLCNSMITSSHRCVAWLECLIKGVWMCVCVFVYLTNWGLQWHRSIFVWSGGVCLCLCVCLFDRYRLRRTANVFVWEQVCVCVRACHVCVCAVNVDEVCLIWFLSACVRQTDGLIYS